MGNNEKRRCDQRLFFKPFHYYSSIYLPVNDPQQPNLFLELTALFTFFDQIFYRWYFAECDRQ